MKETHEVDAWMRQVQVLARSYMAEGLSAEKAEEKAVQQIRREIRSGPPIRRVTT